MKIATPCMVVTHELDLAAEFADRVVLLHKGKCLRVGTPAEVYERELLEEVFEAPLEVEMRPGGTPARDSAARRHVSGLVAFTSAKRRSWPSQAAPRLSAAPSTITARLRAREDGEKPSPPRDCKAEVFGASHCPAADVERFAARMGRPRRCPTLIGTSPSQETGGVSIRIRASRGMRIGTTFNSRARGRGGKNETLHAFLAVRPGFCSALLLIPSLRLHRHRQTPRSRHA